MMGSGRARALTAAVMLLLAGGCAGTASAASRFDPALRFRALPTEHFVIYFHQGEERLAQRLAAIAEETWRTLGQPMGVIPPRKTQVVLADQTELFNGYATPVPYNTVVLYAVTPSGSSSESDDWLRLLFTHEFTHIVHLDRSEGWARIARDIFGRAAYAFPNVFLPQWQIEGLATYEESAITGEGRLHAGDFLSVVSEAARQHRLEPLDRVNGGLTDWPGGGAVYAYGAGFHEYLAERFGAETFATLAAATARRVPYVASPAFKKVYGQSLGSLWKDYEASLTESMTVSSDPPLTQLTRQGFSIIGPRFDRYSCAGCPADIVYTAANPNGFPALYRVGLDGGAPRQLATRYLGSTTGIGRDEIYFDQLELRRNTGLYGDLYAYSRADGRVRQLTSDARLLDPDLSPDGNTLVCVQNHPGQRDLVLVRLKPDTTETRKPDTHDITGASSVVSGFSRTSAISALIAEPGTQFDAPKWSPDGRTIAVARQRLGGPPEIVLVDVESLSVRVLASAPNTRFATPAWRPDGGAIIAAVAPDDDPFNLVELPVSGSGGRQLTHTTGGATWPDLAPDGHTIVFVGYTTGGYDLFSMPYRTGGDDVARTPFDAASSDAPLNRSDQALPDGTDLRAGSYNPLHTLKPTSWTPVVETGNGQVRVGAGITGADVLGYHAYAATATWLVSAPDGATTPNGASPDWQVYYVYDRWRPAFYVSATSDTSFFTGPPTDAGTPTPETRRERQIEGGVFFPIRHVRAQHALRLSVLRSVADGTLSGNPFSRDRTPLRASWQTVTARTYGYSISREDGLAVGATTELVRRDLGSFADATTTTGDARAYLPGLAPHHVVALRLAGGASIGTSTAGRTFLLGGDFPGDSVVDFGSSAFALLRGFAPNTFAGSRVAVTNLEYRWPIARPQRGHGTWPLFLHTLYGAVFADAGDAWTRAFDRRAIKTSVGGELSANLVVGFFAPFTVSVGAAYGHDGSGNLSDRVTAYFRVGKGF